MGLELAMDGLTDVLIHKILPFAPLLLKLGIGVDFFQVKVLLGVVRDETGIFANFGRAAESTTLLRPSIIQAIHALKMAHSIDGSHTQSDTFL